MLSLVGRFTLIRFHLDLAERITSRRPRVLQLPNGADVIVAAECKRGACLQCMRPVLQAAQRRSPAHHEERHDSGNSQSGTLHKTCR